VGLDFSLENGIHLGVLFFLFIWVLFFLDI